MVCKICCISLMASKAFLRCHSWPIGDPSKRNQKINQLSLGVHSERLASTLVLQQLDSWALLLCSLAVNDHDMNLGKILVATNEWLLIFRVGLLRYHIMANKGLQPIKTACLCLAPPHKRSHTSNTVVVIKTLGVNHKVCHCRICSHFLR